MNCWLKSLSWKLNLILTHYELTTSSLNQGNFLKDFKEKLKENELIILSDFSENYSFIMQDAVKQHLTLLLSTIKKVISFTQKAVV